jgi:hypothetical protein
LLIGALIIGSLFPLFCFAQTQTGNASYNPSKSGLHISHASMSFGARVRVTNLKNNREVIATVDGRIPSGDVRIADIFKDAGDAIGMAASGYTEVRLEQLLPERPAPAPEPAAPPPEPAPPPVRQPSPEPKSVPAPAPDNSNAVIEEIEIISEPPVQYVLVERAVQDCSASPVCVAILVLVITAVLLLIAILVIILILCSHRVPVWPWYYPVWVRRRLRYMKNRRN